MHKMWPEPLKEAKGQSSEQAKSHQVTGSPAELATSSTGLSRWVLLPFNPASSFSAGMNNPVTAVESCKCDVLIARHERE